MIPKIIWQTHEKKYEDLPEFQKSIINTWKNLNLDWDYRYIDAEQRSLDVESYSEELHKYYLASGKTRQSDIWRAVVTYMYGGFYADMDSVCIMGIEESFYGKYNKVEIACSSKGYQHPGINSANFGVIKNSNIIKLMLDESLKKYREIGTEGFYMLRYGFPENHNFSEIAEKYSKSIFFNDLYFEHTHEYKTRFNSNLQVTFNGKKIDYATLCKNNRWPI